MATNGRQRIVFDVDSEEKDDLQRMANEEGIRRPNTMALMLFRRGLAAWRASKGIEAEEK